MMVGDASLYLLLERDQPMCVWLTTANNDDVVVGLSWVVEGLGWRFEKKKRGEVEGQLTIPQ
jgi:hypothetical protein